MPVTTNSPTLDVNQLLSSFLAPPKGNSPAEIIARMINWADVYDHPELHTSGDTHPLAIRAKKRTSRQSLKRLVEKYPHLAAQAQAQRERGNSNSAQTTTEAA
jgi:type II secretory pathway component GspD/PulD (secretin)